MTVPGTITDPKMVSLASRMMDNEVASCGRCKEGWPPRHFRATIWQGVLTQRECGSNSRVFDPSIPGFVGYPHCTCDTCF